MRTIFVAEDNVDLREWDEVVLNKAGFNVHAFENGKLTLRALLNSDVHPDLLLTDINMPEMTGTELIKEIRAHKEFDNMKIIIFSSEDEVKDFEVDNVLNDVSLHKPAKAEVLVNLINKLLS